MLPPLNKRVFRRMRWFNLGVYLVKICVFKSRISSDLHSALLDDRWSFLWGKAAKIFHYYLGNIFWPQSNVFTRRQVEKWSEMPQYRNLQLWFPSLNSGSHLYVSVTASRQVRFHIKGLTVCRYAKVSKTHHRKFTTKRWYHVYVGISGLKGTTK